MVCVDGKYSEAKKLKFSVPQESCSGTNLFTCYCSIIRNIVPENITIDDFTDDPSIRKTYSALNNDAHNIT